MKIGDRWHEDEPGPRGSFCIQLDKAEILQMGRGEAGISLKIIKPSGDQKTCTPPLENELIRVCQRWCKNSVNLGSKVAQAKPNSCFGDTRRKRFCVTETLHFFPGLRPRRAIFSSSCKSNRQAPSVLLTSVVQTLFCFPRTLAKCPTNLQGHL